MPLMMQNSTDLMSNSTMVKTENSFLPPFYSSCLDCSMTKIKWNLFWLIQEVCWTWNFWFCFQLSDCLISSNFLGVWKVRLKWLGSLLLSIFLWHFQWVLIDKLVQECPGAYGKSERQFLFTRSGSFRSRALWTPESSIWRMEIFLHEGVLVSTSLLDYLLYTKCCQKNSYEMVAHTIFFGSKFLENVYCIIQWFHNMCTDIFFVIWWFKIICSYEDRLRELGLQPGEKADGGISMCINIWGERMKN